MLRFHRAVGLASSMASISSMAAAARSTAPTPPGALSAKASPRFAQAEAFADPEGPTRVLRLLCTDQELEYAEYRVSGDAEPSER